MRRLMQTLAVIMTMAASPLAAAPVENFVEAPGPLGPLKGTMLNAGANAPVVLIIPGSGPTDRDGNNPLGVKASSYKLIAEGLAQKGISSVRIDKRGMYASRAAVADGNAVTIADYATDVKSWVGVIRKASGAPCVWVMGHSEGSLVALVAATDSAETCGLLLVSGAGRPIGKIMREQLNANPANAPLLPQADKAIDALEAGQRVDTSGMHPALISLFAPATQGFLINWMTYDPAGLIVTYKKPVLILQGGRDVQVSVADAELLKKANPQAKLVVLPKVNHVLKAVESDTRAANIATYADPSLPLADGVVDALAAFVLGSSRK